MMAWHTLNSPATLEPRVVLHHYFFCMSQLEFRTPKGTHDVLPEDHQYMTYIKKAVRHRARQAGYKRIDPPMFENRGIYERGVGEHTDIVEKELYLVKPAKTAADEEPDYALRPEFT